MAKRLFTTVGLTFTAFAAAPTAGTSNAYMALKGGGGTQVCEVLEVMISGKTGTSTVCGFYLARASTLESTLTTLAAPHSDGPEHPSAVALSTVMAPFVAATTGPQVSNTVTDAKLQLGLNGFGGIVRWNAAPTQQWWIVGNTASGGESVLWNHSAAGGVTCAADAHIMYEPS